LMYHRVNDYRKNELSVSVRHFRQQLQWLKAEGFQNITMAELEQLVEQGSVISGKRVLFTFDDGYEDNYTQAFPLLKEFGFSGIFYVATDFIGSQNMYERDKLEASSPEHNRMMNWEQLKILLDEGMEIGSHTLSHTSLHQLSTQDVRTELAQSRSLLEENLQVPIRSFCMPFGAYRKEHIPLIRDAGYSSSCTTEQGFWRQQDLLEIPRVAVLASDKFWVFKQKLTGRMEWAFHLLH
jgi:peptidoglycan/xylan/chitin deacetylase (PgdA/CDA1 family)